MKRLKTILLTALIIATSSTITFAKENSSKALGLGGLGGSTNRPIGGLGSGSSSTATSTTASGTIRVGYRSVATDLKTVRLNSNSTINITMPSDRTELVQGTITIRGNNTNKVKQYTFGNYIYNTETINVKGFNNEPCTVNFRVEGTGTSRNDRIVRYSIR